MSGNAREGGRTTASRVLSLLSAFSFARPELTLTELAQLSGLPVATTHRLAQELLAWGGLERASDGRFHIGLRLWQVGTLTEVGDRAPLHATAVGKIILAFSEPGLLAKVVEQGLQRSTPHTITVPSVLAETLRKVRRDQVAYSLEERSLGASSVAAPVSTVDGTLIASLSVVARSSKNVRDLTFAVRTAALGLSRRLAEMAEHP